MAVSDRAPLLSLEDLHAAYGPVAVLRGLDLVVYPGELVCVIGANGAGKTSTLRAVSGLLAPTRGRIVFDGRPIHGAEPADVLAAGIAHCPEGRRVFPHLTVRENLEMGAYVRRDRRAVDEDLERVATHFPLLAERRRQTAGTLSGGEHLLLAARERACRLSTALGEEREVGDDALEVLVHGATVAPNVRAHLEVLPDGEVGEDATSLGTVGDAGREDVRGLGAVDRAPVEHDAPARGGEQAGNRAQRGRLAGAVGADHADEFAGVHDQIEAPEDRHGTVRGVEVFEAEQRSAVRHGRRRTPGRRG